MRRILFVMLACATISISLPLLIVSIMGGFADNSKGDDMLIDVYFHEENTTKKNKSWRVSDRCGCSRNERRF